ncbi:RsmB/NOP family class I SAM-dependent RNA methyltransferase [Spirobacillus cienkowskii]|uniref:RsmB/NOP family class I SAM-dependent RNA methyltransferase n=1 Tax=Spirobacillus cienkowskii TaxID=495820 RepID=UPI0030CCDBED
MPDGLKSSLKMHAGRYQHLYRLWNLAFAGNELAQMDKWLAKELAQNTKFGSRDRRWYSEYFFAGLRHSYFALFCEEFFENKIPLSELSVFIINFKLKFSNLNSVLENLRSVNKEKFFVWIFLRYLYKKEQNFFDENYFNLNIEDYSIRKNIFESLINYFTSNKELQNQCLFYSIPFYFLELLQERILFSNWDRKTQDYFFNYLDTRPPVWLRLNNLKNLNRVEQGLVKKNYLFEIKNKNSIKIFSEKINFSELDSYRLGDFEVQDYASQLIGQHVNVKLGQKVWDACAGGGGKTIQIASLLNNTGIIYASDIREYKLNEIKQRARKANFFNVRTVYWDGMEPPQFAPEIHANGGFDWVLVDAPCSSLGTLRRSPDVKYKVSLKNLQTFHDLQVKILSSASKAVKKGAHLVYATCSWTCLENEAVVEQFLKDHLEFKLVEQKMLGSPHENADIMFVAVLTHRHAAIDS